MRIKIYQIYKKQIAFFFSRKRRQRLGELRSHIEAIRDTSGCKDAQQRLIQCLHILEHWEVKLSDVKIGGVSINMTSEDLFKEARESFHRYVNSFRMNLSDNWSFEGAPGELGIIVPVNSSLSGFDSVQKYGQLSRRLKRLERQLSRFPSNRALLKRAGFFITIIAPNLFFRYTTSTMKNTNDEKENDVVIEPIKGTEAPDNDSDTLDDSVIAEENALDTIKTLKEKLKKSQAEAKEYLDGWQRAKAEFINIRKRDEDDKKQFMKFANEDLINELIPVLESFDLAMGNKEAWEKADKNWRVGVEYIYSQLKKTLNEHGLEEVNPVGLPFDPTRDEAASYEPVTDEKQDHVIIQVIQKGYSLNKKALRPPKVKVGEFKK